MTANDTRTEDRYPTRLARAAEPIVRGEPAVWPSAGGGPPDAALAAHEARGYSVVEDLLDPSEVEEFLREVRRLTEDRALRADERVVVEKESAEVRSIFAVHELSPAIGDLIRDPRVAGRARRLLGSEVYVHQSRVNYMPGFTGTGFYWHSDFETWHAEDGMPLPRAVSMSLALTDNLPYNGGLLLMPGSHRTFVPCLGATPADHYRESLRDQRVGVPSRKDITRLAEAHGIEQFTGTAGSALWFDANTMHGSGNNITPFPRSNIFVVFNSVENTLVEPFAAPGPRPSFIASRDFTPVPH
ncbi:ectoine hydroxylase [Actinomadura sp. NPDC047616]|uniref:ectoine hydroxylase n=1 Tax=Actinomadura sp. NPDC047616 TaxID=3155914 RepID=UPI0033CCEC9E